MLAPHWDTFVLGHRLVPLPASYPPFIEDDRTTEKSCGGTGEAKALRRAWLPDGQIVAVDNFFVRAVPKDSGNFARFLAADAFNISRRVVG